MTGQPLRVAEVAVGVGRLTWDDDAWWHQDQAVAQVAQVCEQAFGDGLRRVEARVGADQPGLRRVLQRAALRPEGLARGSGSSPDGTVLDEIYLARLADDPPPGTPEAFLAGLNASLPLKRVIAQGLARDASDQVLLCELTYKAHWDLPGGVVDPSESPAAGLARELAEELGRPVRVGPLLAVDWLPPYRQWGDAVLLVFDLGVQPDLPGAARLETREIAGLHFVSPAELEDHVAPYAARVIRVAAQLARGGKPPVYLEDGVSPAPGMPGCLP